MLIILIESLLHVFFLLFFTNSYWLYLLWYNVLRHLLAIIYLDISSRDDLLISHLIFCYILYNSYTLIYIFSRFIWIDALSLNTLGTLNIFMFLKTILETYNHTVFELIKNYLIKWILIFNLFQNNQYLN